MLTIALFTGGAAADDIGGTDAFVRLQAQLARSGFGAIVSPQKDLPASGVSNPIDDNRLLSLLQLSTVIVSSIPAEDPRNDFFDPYFVNQIAKAASTSDSDLRVQAGTMLVKIVDKGNVCGVIDVLFDSDIDSRARNNLWRIVSSLKSSLTSEGLWWAQRAAAATDGAAIPDRGESADTERTSVRGDLRMIDFRSFVECLNLKNIGLTYLGKADVVRGRKVYLHTVIDKSTLERINYRLTAAGFVVFIDNLPDLAGNGIDYRVPDLDGTGIEAAAAIAGVVNDIASAGVMLRAQSAAPVGSFGAWF